MVPNRLLHILYVYVRKRKNAVSPSPATVAILRARHDGAEAASASEKPIEGGERRQWARAAAPGGPLRAGVLDLLSWRLAGGAGCRL